MMEKKMKAYHVTGDWEVFRIPITTDISWDEVWDWCVDKLEGPFKMFNISSGSAMTFHRIKKRSDNLEKISYNKLIQVDIQRKSDAILFKMKWS